MNVDPVPQEQERRIWECVIDDQWPQRTVLIRRPLLFHDNNLHTISEVQNIVDQHVRNSAPQNIFTKVSICLNASVHPNDQELAVLAQCCQSPVENSKHISLSDFTDEEAYRLLQYLRPASLKIVFLSIKVRNGDTLTTTIGLLSDVLLHTCCQALYIENVRFPSDDCHSFGQVFSNKQLCYLHLARCLFPSLDDVSTILGGCFVSKTSWELFRCVLQDKTIPRNKGPKDGYSEFRRFSSAFYQRERTTAGPRHLDRAVRKLRVYVEPLRDAGFSSLLIPCQHDGNGSSGNEARQSRSLEEWVQVFSPLAVNEHVDVLFHILSSNPSACIEAASLRQKKRNASLMSKCCASRVPDKKRIKARQGEKSHP